MAALARAELTIRHQRTAVTADGSLRRGLIVAMTASLPIWAALIYACWG